MHETWPSLLTALGVVVGWTVLYLLVLYLWDRR